MSGKARGSTIGHFALGIISAVLIVFYLMPPKLLLKWLWYFNQYISGRIGVKLTMIGVSSIGHVVLFAAMAIVLLRFTRFKLSNAIMLLVAGAALIELAQRWVPSRSSSLRDLGLNFAGIALGAVFSMVLYGRRWGDCDTIAGEEKESVE